jgi:hypothetical protein
MKYLITSVQYGAPVNAGFLANMLAFAKDKGIDNIHTFVMNGKYKEEEILDKRIFHAGISTIESLRMNSNLRCQDMKILAQQINPLTGLGFKLNRDYSYVLPSPKIRYLSLASTSNNPRALMTTGSLTHGNYKEHTAQGRKAKEQHQYGFVYVEVKNNKIFSTYQVEATKKGDFHYMNERYVGGRKVSSQPEALVLGDWHTGDTCLKARKASLDMIRQLKPKRVILHDLFNGHSINPHEKGHLLSELRSYQQKRDSLDRELKEVYKEVCYLANQFPHVKFLVAESNHDIFLHRYLDSKDFMYQPQNFLFALEMIPNILKGNKPTLQIGLELVGKIPSNFHFGKEDEECRIRGVELLYHGHRGVSGSRGTSNSFDKLNLRMITGHEHAPKLYANGMVVGTNTRLKLDYTKGVGAWMNCNGILYSDGKYGLIPFVV